MPAYFLNPGVLLRIAKQAYGRARTASEPGKCDEADALVAIGPDETALILESHQDQPLMIEGREIERRIEEGSITLFPAQYQLREEPEES